MGRVKRIYYEQATYHVYNRGNNLSKVFEQDEDKVIFLEVLSWYKKRLGFKVYGFVLMPSHFHLLIETNGKNNISKIMQAVLLSFGNEYRKRHTYVGYLWQGRFNSRIIENELYLTECLDYIHQNPVKAGLAEQAKNYIWSSCFIYVGTRNYKITKVVEIDRYGAGDTSLVSVRK